MRRLYWIKTKSLFFLISGILILCIGFLIVSCGKGPQTKVAIVDRGPFAVDLSEAPANIGVMFLAGSALPNISDKGFTIEAWIKRKTNSTSTPFQGTVFSWFDTDPDITNKGRGVMLYIQDNKPFFKINPSFSSTIPSTSFTVGGNIELPYNEWRHVAGVLTNVPPDDPPTSSCAEKPHLEIYVDGVLKNCATTNSQFASTPSAIVDGTMGVLKDAQVPPPAINGTTITSITRFNGVIDEVRFWTIARKGDEIIDCKDTELSFSPQNASCRIDPSILKGYWRLNEGAGSSASDSSGHGLSATKESSGSWDGGWVPGDWH